MSVLLDILQQDIMDTEITKAVLEALTILCSPDVIIVLIYFLKIHNLI